MTELSRERRNKRNIYMGIKFEMLLNWFFDFSTTSTTKNAQIHVHESYNKDTRENDIAVVAVRKYENLMHLIFHVI